jgi:nucleoside 2-deoxyribosyltransferase
VAPTLYFAGPLFTQAERDWNTAVVAELRLAGYVVLLPQEQAAEIVKSSTGLTPTERRQLFTRAVHSVKEADAVVAVLDGPDPDSGTCFECGCAFAFEKPVVGVRTDLRLGGDATEHAVNLMLSESCARVVPVKAFSDTHQTTAQKIIAALRQIGA